MDQYHIFIPELNIFIVLHKVCFLMMILNNYHIIFSKDVEHPIFKQQQFLEKRSIFIICPEKNHSLDPPEKVQNSGSKKYTVGTLCLWHGQHWRHWGCQWLWRHWWSWWCWLLTITNITIINMTITNMNTKFKNNFRPIYSSQAICKKKYFI